MGQDFKAVRRTSSGVWHQPAKLHKKIKPTDDFRERLVFTCSMSDFFIEDADPHRSAMWEIIKSTPNLIYQILTKRPERILNWLPIDWGDGYENVWIGTSVESQKMYDKRVPLLNRVPAKIRFISAEPLLSPVKISPCDCIDWVIVGGESGRSSGKWQFRPCEIKWIEDIVKDCSENRIPVFVKQLGIDLAVRMKLRHSKGGDLSEMPETIQRREFPI